MQINLVKFSVLILSAVFLVSTAYAKDRPGSSSKDKTGAFYIGGMVGSASYEYENVNSSTTSQFYIGYRNPDSIFGFEVGAVDLGDADIDGLVFGLPGWNLNSSGVNVSLVLHTANKVSEMGYLFKLGYYSFDTDLKLDGVTISTEDGSGLSLGAGLDYPMNKYLSLRLELQGFIGVKDFSDNGSVFSGNVGLDIHF